MRTRLVAVVVALALIGASCGGSTPGGPGPSASAAITLRAPASIAARACNRCGDPPQMEVAADLTVEETAGVSGQVTAVNVLFMGGSTTIEGPGTFDQEVLQRFGVSTLRINARGTLTMREIGVHFSPGALDLLPGTLRFSVIFRDDNGHTITSAEAVIQVSR